MILIIPLLCLLLARGALSSVDCHSSMRGSIIAKCPEYGTSAGRSPGSDERGGVRVQEAAVLGNGDEEKKELTYESLGVVSEEEDFGDLSVVELEEGEGDDFYYYYYQPDDDGVLERYSRVPWLRELVNDFLAWVSFLHFPFCYFISLFPNDRLVILILFSFARYFSSSER